MLKNKSIALIIAVLFLLPAAVFASVAGSLDKRFDTDGKLTFLSGFGSTFYDAAVQQADGKIVAVGNCNPTLTTSDFLVVRFNADGSLDTSFDSDGIVTTDFGGGNNFAYSVKILANGKILVAGSAVVTGTGQDFALARYNLNGSLDTNFDADGKLTTDFGATTYEAGAEIMIQSDGKYVLAGRALTAGADYAAARYNIDGSLDTTFDSDGKTVIQLTADFDILTAAALQNNDKIILAGSSGSDFCLVRLNSNGALDPNFDTDGIVTTDFAGLGDTLNGVAIQSDGRIVACGAITQVGNDRDFGCALQPKRFAP